MPSGVLKQAWEVLLWLDQGFSVFTGGYADETFSARCHRCRNNSLLMDVSRRAVNAIFCWQDNHCQQAYRNEMERRGMPPEYRSNDT